MKEKAPVNAESKIGNGVISLLLATLIITNFHLYLIQLQLQFFQIFVYGDVV